MASILDILNTQLGDDFKTRISEHTSESKDKVSIALAIVFPLLLGAMKNNISSAEGRETLNNALADEKYKMFTGEPGKIDIEACLKDNKIVDHILGKKRSDIIQHLGPVIQLKETSLSDIIKISASFLMGILSSLKEKEKIKSSELDELILSVLGSSSKFDNSLKETFFSQVNDGNIIDDVDEMNLAGRKGKKGGSMLGGMVGGK